MESWLEAQVADDAKPPVYGSYDRNASEKYYDMSHDLDLGFAKDITNRTYDDGGDDYVHEVFGDTNDESDDDEWITVKKSKKSKSKTQMDVCFDWRINHYHCHYLFMQLVDGSNGMIDSSHKKNFYEWCFHSSIHASPMKMHKPRKEFNIEYFDRVIELSKCLWNCVIKPYIEGFNFNQILEFITPEDYSKFEIFMMNILL